MKSPNLVISLCLIPLICLIPVFGLTACTVEEGAEVAADGMEVVGKSLAELPENLRLAAPYLQEDAETAWNGIAGSIEVYAEEFGVSQPTRALTECRRAREKLIAGASFSEVVAGAIRTLTPQDLKQMPPPDLSALNGILPFDIDLSECGDNLSEILNSLDVGQISAILRSEAGYHLIQLVDRDGARVRIGHVVFQVNPAIDSSQDEQPDVAEASDDLTDALAKLAGAIERQ